MHFLLLFFVYFFSYLFSLCLMTWRCSSVDLLQELPPRKHSDKVLLLENLYLFLFFFFNEKFVLKKFFTMKNPSDIKSKERKTYNEIEKESGIMGDKDFRSLCSLMQVEVNLLTCWWQWQGTQTFGSKDHLFDKVKN